MEITARARPGGGACGRRGVEEAGLEAGARDSDTQPGGVAACRCFGGPSAARPRRALDPWQRSPPSTPAAAHPSPARPLPLPARQADMESPAVIAEEIISPGNHGTEEISPATPWMRPKDGYSTKSD